MVPSRTDISAARKQENRLIIRACVDLSRIRAPLHDGASSADHGSSSQRGRAGACRGDQGTGRPPAGSCAALAPSSRSAIDPPFSTADLLPPSVFPARLSRVARRGAYPDARARGRAASTSCRPRVARRARPETDPGAAGRAAVAAWEDHVPPGWSGLFSGSRPPDFQVVAGGHGGVVPHRPERRPTADLSDEGRLRGWALPPTGSRRLRVPIDARLPGASLLGVHLQVGVERVADDL